MIRRMVVKSSIRRVVCFALVIAGIPATAFANTTMVAFDKAPSSFTTYNESGVKFSAYGQELSNYNGFRGNNLIFSTGSPRMPLRADFSAVVRSVTVDLGDFGNDSDMLFLEVYDGSNNLLDSASKLISGSNDVLNTLSVSSRGIRYALFGSRPPSLNGSSVYAANFSFSLQPVAPVPEPATWASMLLGLSAAGYVAGRRQRISVALIGSGRAGRSRKMAVTVRATAEKKTVGIIFPQVAMAAKS